MISEASRRARDAFCSPSAAMTFARASLDASAYFNDSLGEKIH